MSTRIARNSQLLQISLSHGLNAVCQKRAAGRGQHGLLSESAAVPCALSPIAYFPFSPVADTAHFHALSVRVPGRRRMDEPDVLAFVLRNQNERSEIQHLG